jgi:hypothetical protein
MTSANIGLLRKCEPHGTAATRLVDKAIPSRPALVKLSFPAGETAASPG